MKYFIIIAVTCAATAAPNGFADRESSLSSGYLPVKNLSRISKTRLPCTHATHHRPSNIIPQQLIERIMSQQQTLAADGGLRSSADVGPLISNLVPGCAKGPTLTLQPLVPPIQNHAGADYNNQIHQKYSTYFNQGLSTNAYGKAPPSTQHIFKGSKYPSLAAPQVDNGYVNTFQPASTASVPGIAHSGASSWSSSGFSGLDASSGPSVASAGGLFSQFSEGNTLSASLGHIIQGTVAASLDPSAEKHIYVHVPPEDLEENQAVKQTTLQNPTKPKKHYKIIFIKAPSAPQANNAQLSVAPQTEEKTLIYVLVKKPDKPSLNELQTIQQLAPKHHKPEVFFINYKARRENEVNIAGSAFSGGTTSGKSVYGVPLE